MTDKWFDIVSTAMIVAEIFVSGFSFMKRSISLYKYILKKNIYVSNKNKISLLLLLRKLMIKLWYINISIDYIYTRIH